MGKWNWFERRGKTAYRQIPASFFFGGFHYSLLLTKNARSGWDAMDRGESRIVSLIPGDAFLEGSGLAGTKKLTMFVSEMCVQVIYQQLISSRRNHYLMEFIDFSL